MNSLVTEIAEDPTERGYANAGSWSVVFEKLNALSVERQREEFLSSEIESLVSHNMGEFVGASLNAAKREGLGVLLRQPTINRSALDAVFPQSGPTRVAYYGMVDTISRADELGFSALEGEVLAALTELGWVDASGNWTL